jgi:hypothetical protein
LVDTLDIVDRVKNRVNTNLETDELESFVEDAISTVESTVGESIDNNNIGSTYFSPITDLATSYVIAYKMDADVDVGVGGDLSINYSDLVNSKATLLEFYTKKAENSLKRIGRAIYYEKTKELM